MNHRSTKQRARQIFLEVADLADAERSAALDLECAGDAALRAEVEALLAAERGAGAFLSSPTGGGASSTGSAASESAGAQIGRYKLLEKIGEGGMGTIWMAQQKEPVQRRVALKIIKLGMDTRQVIARFEAERQALAMMDHPHIAKVLDAGATETGRPYFVMEYIRGVPILEYCDQSRLDTRERLDLFTSVCHAIQHAHQKGIIHRDIKPSNVLVTLHDGVPVPKVIDFGIAKATSSELTAKTLFTEHRQMIGTPAYMSPEQAEMSGLDIDTRSDIYSLGVLLYELLTGTTPFDTKKLLESGYNEMLRAIREDEPHKPSTRISTLGDTGTRTAEQRRSELKKLSLLLRGDLDWIVMKCLEKDRTRRYETANGLAADIGHHLRDEPVTAGAPSAGYKLRKFVKRNRGPVLAGAFVAVALVLGIVGTGLSLRRALIAEEDVRKQLAETDKAQQAEKARADELDQVTVFQADMLKQVDPTKTGVRLTEDVNRRFAAALAKAGVPEAERGERAERFRTQWSNVNATDAAVALIDETILKPAVKAIDDEFRDQPNLDAGLRQVLADRYGELGLYEPALSLQTRALEIRRRELGEEHEGTILSTNNMGGLLQRQGKLAEAEPYYREALEKSRRVLGEEHKGTLTAINNVGLLLHDQGKYAEAERYYREVLEKCSRIFGEEDPSTLDCMNNLGCLLRERGRFGEAEPYLRGALETYRRVLGEEHRDTLNALDNLGYLLQLQGKPSEAEPYHREALDKCRRVLGEEHVLTLMAMGHLGLLLHTQGKFAEAEPFYRGALEKRRRALGEEHPHTLAGFNNLGSLLEAQGKVAEAESYFRKSVETSRRVLGKEHPDAIAALNNLGVLLRDTGRFDEADPYLREALETCRRVLGEEHPDTLFAIGNSGHLLSAQRRFAEAEALLAPGVAACERAFTEPHPTTATLLRRHANALRALGRLEEAEPRARRAVEMHRKHPDWPPEMALDAASILAAILVARGKSDEALDVQLESLPIWRRFGRRANLAGEIASVGLGLLERGTLQAVRDAEPLLRECLAIRLELMPEDWRTANSRSMLGGALLGIAEQDSTLTPEARTEGLSEAEALLLQGYRGMKQLEAAIPPEGEARILEALERLARLCDARGDAAQAAAWRAELEAARGAR